MNRAQRRDSQFKRGLRWDRNRLMEHSSAGMNAIRMAQDYSPEDAARLSVDARMAWVRLTNGSGTMDDFDVLGGMVNTVYVVAQDSGADEIVQDIFDRGMACLAAMRSRYERLGKFGADAAALEYVPDLLDAVDQIISNITPRQAVDALQRSMKLVDQGHVVVPVCFGEIA